ncbi:unnamed protein product [Danaus chrysippus]|uniref:(African queen) hypothetical protein n=1 Tax=Danaus chrysippus TaxID=151541 RepID=A0A8J2W350_9NEOP|nr:unnamed protein product [Danaus chrysippus]
MDIILNDTDIEQEWTTSDQETENFVKNIKFLKLLPLNKEWKSKISDSSVQSDNKKMESVPIVLILATAGGSEEIRDSTEPEASVDEKSILISNEDVENIKEEDDYQIIDPNVSLKTNPEVEDSVKNIEETVDHVVREELRTTVQPIHDQDVNIEEIDKEDITEIEEIKNDIDEALSDCKKDKNCKFTPDDDSSEITEDLFVSQEKYSLEDSEHSLVKDEKSLDKTYKLSIVINKYIIVK